MLRNCRVVIDCTELKCENTTNYTQCYSITRSELGPNETLCEFLKSKLTSKSNKTLTLSFHEHLLNIWFIELDFREISASHNKHLTGFLFSWRDTMCLLYMSRSKSSITKLAWIRLLHSKIGASHLTSVKLHLSPFSKNDLMSLDSWSSVRIFSVFSCLLYPNLW